MKRWLALLLAALLLAGCGSQDAPPEAAGGDGGQTQDQPGSAAAPQGLSVRTARNFDIQYLAGGVKLLIDSAGRELLLAPRGSRAPEGYDGALRVQTPVSRVLFASPEQVSFLEALGDEGLFASIAALTREASRWTAQGILDGFADGRITYIDPADWSAAALAEAAPGLVFLDPEEDAALAGLLDQLGIPYAAAAVQWESTPEARLEWLKFFAAFYGLDREASDLWEAALARLEALRAQASAVPERQRPTAAWAEVSGSTVRTQAGGSPIARQLEQAGAVYALGGLEGDGEVEMTLEEFVEKCADADILICAVSPQEGAEAPAEDPLFTEFKSGREGRVFAVDDSRRRRSAWAVEEFEDLLAICHPELVPDHVFAVYQPLAG